MKIFVGLCLFFVCGFCGCGKKLEDKNQKIAQTYYNLCMLEISQNSDKNDSPQTTYRKALSYIQEAINYQSKS